MVQESKVMLIQCPRQNRQVEVTYAVTGNWFNREYLVLSCPAINDYGGGCDRECKLQVERPLGLNNLYSRQMLS